MERELYKCFEHGTVPIPDINVTHVVCVWLLPVVLSIKAVNHSRCLAWHVGIMTPRNVYRYVHRAEGRGRVRGDFRLAESKEPSYIISTPSPLSQTDALRMYIKQFVLSNKHQIHK